MKLAGHTKDAQSAVCPVIHYMNPSRTRYLSSNINWRVDRSTTSKEKTNPLHMGSTYFAERRANKASSVTSNANAAAI
jgi:hypothetical protein